MLTLNHFAAYFMRIMKRSRLRKNFKRVPDRCILHFSGSQTDKEPILWGAGTFDLQTREERYILCQKRSKFIGSGKRGYTITLRTSSSMTDCEKIIGSIEHFYRHLKIEICKFIMVNTKECGIIDLWQIAYKFMRRT